MLIVTVPILINKDVFGPNYNDLKLTVRNHYYVFIKLNRPKNVSLFFFKFLLDLAEAGSRWKLTLPKTENE